MNKILFIDTLTTGLNPERCAISRIGGVLCKDGPCSMEEAVRFDIVARPFEGARIVDSSLWVGGMTRSRLIYFPEQRQAFRDFMSIVQQNIDIRDPKDKIYIAGFNASSFDVPFIRGWFTRNDNTRFRDCFHVQTLDIMSLAAIALMNERRTMPDFHLETAAKFLGVTPVKRESYSCLDNAMTCVAMYRVLKQRLAVGEDKEYKSTDRLIVNHKIS